MCIFLMFHDTCNAAIIVYGAVDRLHTLDWTDCSSAYTGDTPTVPHPLNSGTAAQELDDYRDWVLW